MDEPFSAVDPVVREELQTEILRLQSELRKTIVFVTHDIDEALKLGDKVAVFGRGGVLQQYDEPARLLSNPAKRFRRRLRRRRPRLSRSAVPPRDRASAARHPVRRRVRDRRICSSVRTTGCWSPSPTERRTGGSTPTACELHRNGSSLYDSTFGGGSLFRPDDSLRQALDCCSVVAVGSGRGGGRRRTARRRCAAPTTCSQR